MGKMGYYQYYVEGDDEKKLLSVLKTDMELIISGKVEKFNVTQELFTKLRLMQLKRGTVVILVFDTDAGNVDILKENIRILQKNSMVKDVICIPQVNNLEDELVRSCEIKRIKELTGSRSNKDYKHCLIVEKNLKAKLIRHKFDIDKFWDREAVNGYSDIKNGAHKIKK